MTEQAEVRDVWQVLTKVASEVPGLNGVLRCPACGDLSVHLCGIRTVGGVRDRMGAALVERVRDGAFSFDERVDPVVGQRGVQIEIGTCCENGNHVCVIGLQFHKGNTFMCWKLLRTADPKESPADIWRD